MVKYLFSKSEIKKLVGNDILDLSLEEQNEIKRLSMKEKALRSKGIIITDGRDNILESIDKDYGQHFYPFFILDYAKVIYEHIKFGKELPILSIDSHDTLYCDFDCQDCLSGGGANLCKSKFHDFDLGLNEYLNLLREIYEFSKKRGFEGIRFEQSGEGNPDFYKHRSKLIEIARKRYGLKTVYVTTTSGLNEDLINSLAKNAYFLRVSFPGLDDRSYSLYSNQKRFTFKRN